jgi:hypothetical protein
VAQDFPPRLIQLGDIGTGRPDAQRVRLPPVSERRERDADGQRRRLNVVQAGRFAQFRQVTLPGASELRLVTRLRVHVVHGPPERGEGTAASGVIPHAGGDQAAGAGDPRHLP